ncbi:hypothetical protein B0T17DRAFT_485230 [Bombardia bombarda]|uniref:Uncharacterized protein n=1 Tax=Bombardia bombarda TaxID=252184 RepID=A0AA39XLV0_9PEZI|nr:hypothetical protein B0T17DRAFT_485230 [Bombardia bombarda]
MSPIIARAAMRAAAARRTVSAGTTRQFSLVQSLRTFARSFESHPFERLPVASNSQAADWGRQFKRVGSQAIIYFPAMAVMLGWPYAAALTMDDHIQ